MHSAIRSTWTSLLLAALCLAAPTGAQANDHLICKDAATPTGATQVGALQPLFRDCPRIADVDFTGRADDRKYYSGVYTGPPRTAAFTNRPTTAW